MRPEDRDAALLWDMREAAHAISTFMQGVNFARFEDDKMVRSAVERQFLIIGEAARQISPEFREQHPEVPWRGVVGLRNVLAHDYGEVLVERLWLYATQRIPELITLLDSLVPPETT